MKKSNINRIINDFSGLGIYLTAITMLTGVILFSCTEATEKTGESAFRHHVIFDTDANNEIDDQHALAYLLFSGDVFAVEGVTVNATSGPGHGISGHIDGQYDEAKRPLF